MSRLDRGLGLSPQRLRGHKGLEVKGLFPREQVVHGLAQLMGEHGERLGFAVCVFEFHRVCFPGLALPNKEDRGFGKGPAQMLVVDLFARRPQSFAIGFLGALYQATVGHKYGTRGKRWMSGIS